MWFVIEDGKSIFSDKSQEKAIDFAMENCKKPAHVIKAASEEEAVAIIESNKEKKRYAYY